jgi:acyl-CoA thioesterase II
VVNDTWHMDFVEMMHLERHGADTFVGTGPAYPWGGLYGGQIVAQALRAAGHTAPEPFAPHSLHAYFIRAGDHTEPIRFEVERLRDGRSFATRQVVARQSNGAILTMICSFHTGEDSPSVSPVVAPSVPRPDDLADTSWTPAIERRSIATGDPGQLAWMRISGDLGPLEADPVLHCCGIAYASDDLPAEPIAMSHPDHGDRSWDEQPDERQSQLMIVSLDHALWFHRPHRADTWHLEQLDGSGLLDARGLARGRFFDTDGNHVASVAQEVLARTRRR